jgi:hypothetical protein
VGHRPHLYISGPMPELLLRSGDGAAISPATSNSCRWPYQDLLQAASLCNSMLVCLGRSTTHPQKGQAELSRKRLRGSKNRRTDLHECRQRGAILVWRPQLPIGATILIADELTRLAKLSQKRQPLPPRLELNPIQQVETGGLRGNHAARRLNCNCGQLRSVRSPANSVLPGEV